MPEIGIAPHAPAVVPERDNDKIVSDLPPERHPGATLTTDIVHLRRGSYGEIRQNARLLRAVLEMPAADKPVLEGSIARVTPPPGGAFFRLRQ